MPIMKIDEIYCDIDFSLLSRHLELLDIELTRLNAAIIESTDPESDGFYDSGEYFIGSGFVAIQRYFTATALGLGLSMEEALDIPPMISPKASLAATINTGANYWKHVEEWLAHMNKPIDAKFPRSGQKTLDRLERITLWQEYTCSNLLAILLNGQRQELSLLLPKIEEWRNNAFALHDR